MYVSLYMYSSHLYTCSYICLYIQGLCTLQAYLAGRSHTLTTPVDPTAPLRTCPKSANRYLSEAVR